MHSRPIPLVARACVALLPGVVAVTIPAYAAPDGGPPRVAPSSTPHEDDDTAEEIAKSAAQKVGERAAEKAVKSEADVANAARGKRVADGAADTARASRSAAEIADAARATRGITEAAQVGKAVTVVSHADDVARLLKLGLVGVGAIAGGAALLRKKDDE